MRSNLCLAMAILSALLLGAGDAPAHTPAVRAALQHHVAAVARAGKAYAEAMADADRQLGREATAAQKAAMAAGDLVAANDAGAVAKAREPVAKPTVKRPTLFGMDVKPSGKGGVTDSPALGHWKVSGDHEEVWDDHR